MLKEVKLIPVWFRGALLNEIKAAAVIKVTGKFQTAEA
jgi:hypothetical protein